MAGLGESKPHTLPCIDLTSLLLSVLRGTGKLILLTVLKVGKKKVFSSKEVLGGIPFFGAEIYCYCLESSDGEALVA